jgi:hypothetical protein
VSPSAPNSFGRLFCPKSEQGWQAVLRACKGGPGFREVVDVARKNGCRSVVLEQRYVDLDYRSDYSAFWSKRFTSMPPFATRVHFFTAVLRKEQLHDLPVRSGYLGYSVLRPGPHLGGRVGRTVLKAPARIRAGTLATIEDEVSLFGNRLKVRGVPFAEQDGEYLRCAHAAIWGCHYTAFKRGLIGRRTTTELADLVPTLLSAHRSLPSPGMNLEQVQAVFLATGQPALLYMIDQLPEVRGVESAEPELDQYGNLLPAGLWDIRLFSVICRYLNSGFPVMIFTSKHAFNLFGWYRSGKKIRFVACDDQRRPYEVVTNPFRDAERSPWLGLMVPLPPKVFLSGEMAENWGHHAFSAYGSSPNVPDRWKELAQALATSPKGVSLRTFLRDSRVYKEKLVDQKRDDEVVRELRLARLPHYLWVVEAHDRERRKARRPSVLAEVIFDPDSSDHEKRNPRRASISLPSLTVINPPDDGKPFGVADGKRFWRSQLDV